MPETVTPVLEISTLELDSALTLISPLVIFPPDIVAFVSFATFKFFTAAAGVIPPIVTSTFLRYNVSVKLPFLSTPFILLLALISKAPEFCISAFIFASTPVTLCVVSASGL